MTKKKEIRISKSLIRMILKSLFLSILTLFIINNLSQVKIDGSIKKGQGKYNSVSKEYTYTLVYVLKNPINGKKYFKFYEKLNQFDENWDISYIQLLKDFYLPSLFGNLSHIFIGFIIYFGGFLFFKNYKITIK